eukprot:1462486-Amphidinium_carterae.1
MAWQTPRCLRLGMVNASLTICCVRNKVDLGVGKMQDATQTRGNGKLAMVALTRNIQTPSLANDR